MINMCPQCGSWQWNKKADDVHITCPECCFSWPYQRGSLLLLTGCSGVGKTTTAVRLFRMQKSFAVLDGDMFYEPENPDILPMLEKMMNLSAGMNQQGRPILWTLAGGLDRLHEAYHRQFFSAVHCLALTCAPEELHRRMTEGRGISDQGWLEGSQNYNEYFRQQDRLGEVSFDTLDVTCTAPDDAARKVLSWLESKRY